MALKATCLGLWLTSMTLGHMACPTCIPLEDLLAPGYGISLSVDGLSSAAAYHNGTMVTLASMSGSEEYRKLMSSTLRQHETHEPRLTALECLARIWQEEPTPWDKDILKLLHSYVGDLMQMIKDAFDPPEIPEPISPLDSTEQMLQVQLLALQPFANMTPGNRSQVTVAIQLPAWFLTSPYACSFYQIAESTFGRFVGLESASSCAYTALGHELCRVSQEAYQCNGPGRLAIFEYNGHLATASIIKTPLDIFDRIESRYSSLTSHDPAELSKWINLFLEACSPDMITLAGSSVESSTFQEALNLSNAVSHVQSSYSVEAKDIIVQGAAQAAKNALENHNTDCTEFNECLDIRREADSIAGKYRFRRPKVWPAVDNRHVLSDLERELQREAASMPGKIPIEDADPHLNIQLQLVIEE